MGKQSANHHNNNNKYLCGKENAKNKNHEDETERTERRQANKVPSMRLMFALFFSSNAISQRFITPNKYV